MKLLRFPFLIRKGIIEQLELHEVLALSTLSKYLKTNISCCLCHQRYKVEYNSMGFFRIRRIFSDESFRSTLIVFLRNQIQQELVYSYQFWPLLNQNSISVNISEPEDSWMRVSTYWPSIDGVEVKMLAFIIEVISKSVLELTFRNENATIIPNIMNVAQNLKLEELNVVVSPTTGSEEESHDELVRKVLDECRDVEHLMIKCKTSANFEYDFKSSFNVQAFVVIHAQWVTKNHVVNHLLKCNIVNLKEKYFDDKELSEIFEEWTIQPKTKYLTFAGIEDFYSTSSLINVVGYFPGARAVRKAQIPSDKVFKFKEGRGYVIRATNGTEALVAKFTGDVFLEARFEANNDIDGMDTDHEEPEDDVEGNQNDAIEDDNANDERNINN